MEDRTSALQAEAAAFAGVHNDQTRSLAWSSIPYFSKKLQERVNLGALTRSRLSGRPEIRALTMACGDMKGEYGFFKAMGATAIDAFDISEGQKERFNRLVNDGQIPVAYAIADVNEITLSEEKYDLVYMQQSLHHIEDVEHVVAEIKKSLKPDGLFVLNDYVGEPFLQRGPKQRTVCQRLWDCLPARLRTDHNGRVWDKLPIPDKRLLSPFEAIRSHAILPALRSTFNVVDEFLFGGIVFPIINNYARNYDLEQDDALIRMLWELDVMLVENGTVEPSFVRAVYSR